MKMILRFALLLLAILPFASPLEAAWWDPVTNYFKGPTVAAPASIRILLDQ